MDAVIKEILSILPENELLRFVLLMTLIIVVPIKPAIWVGQGIRYAIQWIRCRIFGTHSFEQKSGQLNLWGQPMSGMAQCRVCLQVLYF